MIAAVPDPEGDRARSVAKLDPRVSVEEARAPPAVDQPHRQRMLAGGGADVRAEGESQVRDPAARRRQPLSLRRPRPGSHKQQETGNESDRLHGTSTLTIDAESPSSTSSSRFAELSWIAVASRSKITVSGMPWRRRSGR